MNLSVDFIRGFSLRVASYFLQIFFPVYLVYYIRAAGLIYWAFIVIFWISAGVGMFLPYFFKNHSFCIEFIFLLTSILMIFSSRYFFAILLIILSAIISALTGKYAYFSFVRASYSGILKYMRGTGAGLFISAIISVLVFYFGFFNIIINVGFIILALSIILITSMLISKPEEHNLGNLSVKHLFSSVINSLKFSYNITGNALSWISFTTYIYYYLYVGIKAGYIAVLSLMLLSTTVIFIIRFLLSEKYKKNSKAVYFVLYSLAFLLIFLSVIFGNFCLDIISAALIGISQGALPAMLLYESLNTGSKGSYDGYIIYNAFIGLGELLGNVFFGILAALSAVKLFYLLPFVASIIVIFLEIKYKA